MRLYSFTNMYTNGIHAGIQTAHMLHEMFRYYDTTSPWKRRCRDTLNAWADGHKTIIVLNGGNVASLESTHHELLRLTKGGNLPYPVAKFHEDRESLNCALTCVGIVVPESVYTWAPNDQLRNPFSEVRFISEIIRSRNLAS